MIQKDDRPNDKTMQPIIVVKCPVNYCMYIIQVKGSSWPYLISENLVTYNHTIDAVSD